MRDKVITDSLCLVISCLCHTYRIVSAFCFRCATRWNKIRWVAAEI